MAGNSTDGDFRNPADRNQRDERRSSDSPPAEVISGWMVARLSEWQSKERPAPELPERSVSQSSAPASSGPWLIFADGGGVGEALASLLRAQGETSILVSRGESYERTDSEHFRIHPQRSEHLRALFEAALPT